MNHYYYVYIMSSFKKVTYIGVTNDLERRVYEHKNNLVPGFTARYNAHSLVFFEETSDVVAAIEREKQLKRWSRQKKFTLILRDNPNWEDLSESWFG